MDASWLDERSFLFLVNLKEKKTVKGYWCNWGKSGLPVCKLNRKFLKGRLLVVTEYQADILQVSSAKDFRHMKKQRLLTLDRNLILVFGKSSESYQ